MAPQNFEQAGNGDELELSRILRNSSPGHATSDFRDRLRDEFLRDCDLVSESRECKPERSSPPEMANLEDNMRSFLEMPTADSDYRAELRQRFIDFASVAQREAQAAQTGESENSPRGLIYRIGVFAAAVAAALFVAFYLPPESELREENFQSDGGALVDHDGTDPSDQQSGNESLAELDPTTPEDSDQLHVDDLGAEALEHQQRIAALTRWRVENPESLDGVSVDGLLLEREGSTSTSQKSLMASLARGAHLQTGAGDINLDLDSGLRMRLLANTSIQFHALPEAGSMGEIGFEVQEGEIFLETSASFAGNPIRIQTVDVEVMVTGTALGVKIDEMGTCTCVDHGQVEVLPLAAPNALLESVEDGRLFFVMRSGECIRVDFESQGPDHEHINGLAAFAELR